MFFDLVDSASADVSSTKLAPSAFSLHTRLGAIATTLEEQ
jgi:hypothetical protein